MFTFEHPLQQETPLAREKGHDRKMAYYWQKHCCENFTSLQDHHSRHRNSGGGAYRCDPVGKNAGVFHPRVFFCAQAYPSFHSKSFYQHFFGIQAPGLIPPQLSGSRVSRRAAASGTTLTISFHLPDFFARPSG